MSSHIKQRTEWSWSKQGITSSKVLNYIFFKSIREVIYQ